MYDNTYILKNKVPMLTHWQTFVPSNTGHGVFLSEPFNNQENNSNILITSRKSKLGCNNVALSPSKENTSITLMFYVWSF